jgi:5-methyltetrahydropteroyltriglutamate--homocysteine methyltransferase
MTAVYRADTVGSLLRPDYLVKARTEFESGQMAPARYKEIEDRAVDQVIAMQEGAGLDVVTDGELRRHTFIDQLLEAVDGLTPDPAGHPNDHIPVPFHDEAGTEQSVFSIPLSVTEKLRRRRMMTVEEYDRAAVGPRQDRPHRSAHAAPAWGAAGDAVVAGAPERARAVAGEASVAGGASHP